MKIAWAMKDVHKGYRRWKKFDIWSHSPGGISTHFAEILCDTEKLCQSLPARLQGYKECLFEGLYDCEASERLGISPSFLSQSLAKWRKQVQGRERLTG